MNRRPPYAYRTPVPIEDHVAAAVGVLAVLQDRLDSGEIDAARLLELMEPGMVSMCRLVQQHIDDAPEPLRNRWSALLEEMEQFSRTAAGSP